MIREKPSFWLVYFIHVALCAKGVDNVNSFLQIRGFIPGPCTQVLFSVDMLGYWINSQSRANYDYMYSYEHGILVSNNVIIQWK